MAVIGIVGSRRRNSDEDMLLTARAFLKVYRPGDTIVSGGCPTGGDYFAEVIHHAYNVPMQIHYPDKSKLNPELLKKAPRVAYAEINYARNTLVANDADKLIAVVADTRTGGTEDTIKKFCRKCLLRHTKAAESQLIKNGRLLLV